MNKAHKSKKIYHIIFLLLIIFCINSYVLSVRITNREYPYQSGYEAVMKEIQQKKYAYAVEVIRDKQVFKKNMVNEEKELIYFADCYDAWTLYQAYMKQGCTDKADYYKNIYEENEKKIVKPQLKEALEDYKNRLEKVLEKNV